MPKTKISEYSSTANSNTDIGGINVDEGCAPSGINDAIRTMMAQLKNFQTGTGGDSFNGPVGSTTASTGAFTTLSATGVTTVQAGTAAAPAITTSGDTNTGIYFPAADTIAFTEGGTEAARIDSAGNFGLGVTPSAWGTYKAIQLNAAGYSMMGGTAGAVFGALGVNYYFDGSAYKYINSSYATQYLQSAGIHTWKTAVSGTAGNSISFTDAMTLTAAGELLVGTTSSSENSKLRVQSPNSTEWGDLTFLVNNSSGTKTFALYNGAAGFNAAQTVAQLAKNTSTSRSLNAAGTLNASGADYAEYMTKSGEFTLAKGDVIGINSEGKLTNVFANSVSFAVKSTNPSYVGNDTWGIGFDDDDEGLETARQLVDRIAFAGQVPVNVTGATAGEYIVPVNDNGAIKGVAVSNPTFEQYQQSVGKVIAIEQDGRARIIVKVA
jgi:hypothetical protein